MIKITLNSHNPMTPDQMALFARIFAKLSANTTLCKGQNGYIIMDEVKVENSDLDSQEMTCGASAFLDAVKHAMQTTVTVSIDTDSGTHTRTMPLFAGRVECYEDTATATWKEEPEFIVCFDDGDVQLRFFGELLNFIASDIDYRKKKVLWEAIEW